MRINVVTKYIRKVLPLRKCGAVIVAAGNASRMGGIDKVMAPIGGEPMIVRTVRAFQLCDAIAEIVIVTRPDLVGKIMEDCSGFEKVSAVVAGGKTRQESVRHGLSSLSDSVKLVAVHDGARPLIKPELIDRVVRAANTYHAAIPAIPVKDTIKTVRSGFVASTPDRKHLQAIQTPQVFDRDLLCGALQRAEDEFALVTDDSSAVERIGMSVYIVEGDERNLKVTTPMDLKIAEMLLEEM